MPRLRSTSILLVLSLLLSMAALAGVAVLMFGHATVASTAHASVDPGWVRWLADVPTLDPAVRRAVLLERMSRHPEEVGAIVTGLQQLQAEGAGAELDAVELELIVAEGLERSLVASRSRAEASVALDHRSRIRERSGQVIHALAEQARAAYTGEPAAALADDAWVAQVNRLVEIAGGANLAEPVLADLVSRLQQDVLRLADAYLEQAAASLETIRAASTATAVEPAAGREAHGPLQQQRQAVHGLLVLVENDGLHAWSVQLGLDEFYERLEAKASQLAELDAELSAMQWQRYNLWAIRQIYAAEDSREWPVYLGSVDRGLLHPSVFTLWNSVHDRRFAEVEDREHRPQVVRRLLTTTPVVLERF